MFFSRLGQKGRLLKHINDNQPLFENKTAEADLGNSFQIRTPENLVSDFEKLDLVHNTPFVRPVVKAQNDSGIETPNDTHINKNKKNPSLNSKPDFSLSTKQSIYTNKENLPEKKYELNTSDPQKLNLSNTGISSYSLIVGQKPEEIENKSPNNIKDNTYYVSPETSRYNYDTSLYHSIRENTIIPDSSHSYFSIGNSNTEVDSSLTTKQLGCQSINDKPNHITLELSPAAKRNDFVIRARSPICPPPVEFIQDGEFKRPINSSSNVCVKCANENYICVKGINYSILNTLGHGGSSIVYEVNMF